MNSPAFIYDAAGLEADQQIFRQSRAHILNFEVPGAPANWHTGFSYPYQIGAGGTETPFIKEGKWYLRVWNCKDRKHYIYSYSDDLFLADN